jgi:hypothetical protein
VLHLGGIIVSPSHSMSMTLGSFLSFHRKISHLTLYIRTFDEIAPIVLPSHSLPHLSYLEADDMTVKMVVSCPCSPPRKLEKLRGLQLDSEFWNEAALSLRGIDKGSLLVVRVASIQSVVDLQRLAVSCPNIEYLDLDDIDLEMEVWDEDTASNRVLLTVRRLSTADISY